MKNSQNNYLSLGPLKPRLLGWLYLSSRSFLRENIYSRTWDFFLSMLLRVYDGAVLQSVAAGTEQWAQGTPQLCWGQNFINRYCKWCKQLCQHFVSLLLVTWLVFWDWASFSTNPNFLFLLIHFSDTELYQPLIFLQQLVCFSCSYWAWCPIST